MRVIKPSRIRDFQDMYPKAATGLARWLDLVEHNDWTSIQQLRRVFPSADAVTVPSGRTVTVFNIGGNDFRLITAIHYNSRIVYTMLFMTHAEYDKDAWKERL
ncbi:MAG: type II toxin-antitoxin system HigB family toxin [Phycisphaerae bacterium]